MKLHPLKNIPEPDNRPKESSLAADFTAIVLTYATGIVSLLFAGIITTIYGAVLGWLLGLTSLGTAICSGFAKFQISIQVTDLINVGAALGFVAFCVGLVKITRK